MIPTTFPHGRTAQRTEWRDLPAEVRRVVEEHCGGEVVEAHSQRSGYTPSFASVLLGADGRRYFVKAASLETQAMFAGSLREEARKLAWLPSAVPAPALRWTDESTGWVVLGIEHVEARTPERPWRQADLDAALAMLDDVARLLTPPPAEAGPSTFAEQFGGWPALWDQVGATRPDLAHRDELASLAARALEVTVGDTLGHTDVRDDNILLTADGRVLLCDWNWPVVGAGWIDSLLLLIGPRGDGLDVAATIAANARLRAVPAEHVDCVLALLLGYFLTACREPVPTSSPFLREAQRWQGAVVLDWLVERRGWAGQPG